jgi:hypothetical protein
VARSPKSSTKQISPFAPISNRRVEPTSFSSAGNTPLFKRSQAAGRTNATDKNNIAIVDADDDDSKMEDLREEDLKVKLKQQKQHGRETGQLLNQLHENYNQLLIKYAQAENTIDQLRFQPRIVGDHTPPNYAAEVSTIDYSQH